MNFAVNVFDFAIDLDHDFVNAYDLDDDNALGIAHGTVLHILYRGIQ